MRPTSPTSWRPVGRRPVTLLVAALLLASCDSGAAPSSGSGRPATPPPPVVVPATALPSGGPSSPAPVAPSAAPRADVLAPGALAVTVSDRLRVRAAPRVAEDSARYDPLLPLGTQLVITGGPVKASGYTWYRVVPLGVTLKGGAEDGWVAIADHDGTPWVDLAKDPTPGYELARADVQRSRATTGDARAAAERVNAFGVALYRRMVRGPGLGLDGKSVVVSPTSVAIALGMARAGARGATATEMDAVLRASGWESLGSGLNALQQRLASRDAAWTDDDGHGHALALRMANMAFAQDGWPVKQAYLDAIAEAFGNGLALVDYLTDHEGARQAINGWVARQTINRIPELLGPSDLTPDTKLALVNAIYLKADWQRKFDAGSTKSRPFTRGNGSVTRVPTMSLEGEQDVPYAHGAGWQATELRYLGVDGSTPLAMTLILPDNAARFERALTGAQVATIVSRLDAQRERLGVVRTIKERRDCDVETYAYSVRLFMPRFGIDTRANLVPVLQGLGMRLAVDRNKADFSAIVSPDVGRLFIDKVIHQANIDVDERGTEAAAATAVIMADTTGGCGGPMPARMITLRLDKPFLFVLRDVGTGAILFMGRVVDPSAR